jgi:2-methylcitrate dehydratase PrpD
MGATKTVVNFCSNLRYEVLSPDVVNRVKYLALDFLGVAARGSLTKSAEIVRNFAKDMAPTAKESVIIGSDTKSTCLYAALANGTASHSLELDDVSNEASAHPGVVVFPTALATGELTRCDGRRFIEGVVLGYEVMVRLGKALSPANHYARGFHPTGTCGAFGAAIAASKILNLDAEQMLSALGIVGSQAAASMEFLTSGACTKHLHPGWAAHSGIIAALLAKRGFVGPSTIIEGKSGFLHAYSDDSDVCKLLAGLGDHFEVMRVSVKPHACCRYKQGTIDGILKIMSENKLKEQEIEKVTLGILKAAFPIIAEPKELKYSPRSVIDAQFSMPFGAAVAILHGRASLDEYIVDNLGSPKVKEMMGKVSCVPDLELERVYPKQWPASVEIATKDGRRFYTRIEYPKGDPENPLSWEELIQKFNELSSPVFSKDRRRKIISRVSSLETEESISNLAILLSMS